MRLYALSLLIFTVLSTSKMQYPNKLVLLDNNGSFKNEILDQIYNAGQNPNDIGLIKIQKIRNLNGTEKTGSEYELRIFSIPKKYLPQIVEGKYDGYYEYKDHILLVYGDNVDHFFTKSNTFKKFDYPLYKLNWQETEPPVSLHLKGCIYRYTEKKFILVSTGMF